MTRLVCIDVETKTYSVYYKRELVNTIQSAEFLDEDFIEQFRVNTANVMKMIDGTE